MESGKTAARAVSFVSRARDDQCRAAITFHHAGGDDSDDPAVPAVAIKHQAVRLAQSRVGIERLLDFRNRARLFLLALQIQLLQPGSNFAGANWIGYGEKLNDVAGDVHASGGVDAWGDAKRDVSGRNRPARAVCCRAQFRDLEESFQ